jgi:hypothetical protein
VVRAAARYTIWLDATEEHAMDSIRPATDLGAERVQRHAERPGFRITELRMGPTQQVPWHCHTNVQDTFYVLDWTALDFAGTGFVGSSFPFQRLVLTLLGV